MHALTTIVPKSATNSMLGMKHKKLKVNGTAMTHTVPKSVPISTELKKVVN